MELKDFEEKIQELRIKNGWIIRFECKSIWTITVFDRDTGEKLAETGATGLSGIEKIFERPFNMPPWV